MRKRTYKRPFLLYHWSPVERRAAILKRGLRVSSRPVQHSATMPHTCFSDSPSLAWALSARFMNKAGDWDCWMCWSNVGELPIRRRDDLGKFPTEYRIEENIPKSKLWHVGTRRHEPRKRVRAEPVPGGKVLLRKK